MIIELSLPLIIHFGTKTLSFVLTKGFHSSLFFWSPFLVFVANMVQLKMVPLGHRSSLDIGTCPTGWEPL